VMEDCILVSSVGAKKHTPTRCMINMGKHIVNFFA